MDFLTVFYPELGRIAWNSTYTYIALLFVAAAFVAYISRPKNRAEAVQRLYAGDLLTDTGHAAEVAPCLRVRCLEAGKVYFERIGVEGLTSSGAVSWAVEIIGKDVVVKERVSPGFINDTPVVAASFTADLIGHEWRHVRWTDEDSGLWCAFSLHVREGIGFTVQLHR